jgi:orotidine-5'-phosphate decarboxylase
LDEAEAVLSFNRAIIDGTIDVCACFKVQIAYYEALGLAGLRVYAQTLRYIRDRGALVIADIKRGDIADTAAQYAKAHFSGDLEADLVTLSPYMGMDTLTPWLPYVEDRGKGVFVLLRTSNPGMRDFEYRELKSGGRVYHEVGNRLSELSLRFRGSSGFSALGAVVGCTEKDEAVELRRQWPHLFFLIPGYGAQGGAAEDAALLLKNGNGGVVNASRSILKAWTHGVQGLSNSAEGILPGEITFQDAARASCAGVIEMTQAIRTAVANQKKGKE